MIIVLVGYMGSGKSTIGAALAKALSFQFMDLDHYIEQAEGSSITDLFQQKGELYFRRKEESYLAQLLSTSEKLVLATGGGTPCYGTIAADLKNNPDVVTVYLKHSLDTLTTRLYADKNTRPLIAHLDSEELLNDFIRKHLFERSYYYNQASIVLDCDRLTPNQVVEKILLALF